jgi:predicted N-acyltransferase
MHSLHYIAHPGLRRAIADYLQRERREVAHISEYLEEHTPFRKTGGAINAPGSSKTD